jgi:hypothetical protein
MLTIVQRGGATHEKPPEVVRGTVARLPWAWDGLCMAIPFNDATRDSTRDLVGNVAPSEWSGNLAFTKDNRGNVALTANPTQMYFGYVENPAHNRPSTAVTAYVRLRREATPSTGTGIFCKVHTAATNPWRTWAVQAADTNALQLAGTITVSGTNYVWENTDYTTDTATWINVFLRWTSGTSPTQHIYGERGQLYSSSSLGTTLSGSLTYNTTTPQPIRFNTGDYTGVTYFGSYSQALLWSRRLTDTEIQALVADPYGWYSPRRETLGLSSPYPLVSGQGVMREVSSG